MKSFLPVLRRPWRDRFCSPQPISPLPNTFFRAWAFDLFSLWLCRALSRSHVRRDDRCKRKDERLSPLLFHLSSVIFTLLSRFPCCARCLQSFSWHLRHPPRSGLSFSVRQFRALAC